jgi:membrane protein implicated in regulation of membrane protease activity
LSSIIQASFDVYSQGVIWLSYSFLLTLASGVMLYSGLVFPWVFYTALILSVISTYLLIIDIEREFKPSKETVLDQVEEVVLTWEEDILG